MYCNTTFNNAYRILAVVKVETDIIAGIITSLMGQAEILVIMYAKIFTTDFIVFISKAIMCLTSD